MLGTVDAPSRDAEATGEPAAVATDASPAISRREVRQEVRDFARRQERRRHLLPRALLVGIVAGLVAVLFRRTLDVLDAGRSALIERAHALGPWGVLVPIAIGALGAGTAVWLVRRLAPEVAGSGIPHVKAVLHHLRGLRWQRVLAVKFASGTAGIGAGLALGREGPTVQMGAAVGQMVSRLLHVTVRERQTLIAAGAGAGLAAAFNAPLAGVIFVLEELRRDFAAGALTAAFVASVTADVVTRLLLGQLPVFHATVPGAPPLANLPAFALLGVVAGGVGVCFNRSLLGTLNLLGRWRERPFALGAGVGALVGLAGWFVPAALGGGAPLVQRTLQGEVTLVALPLLLLLRFALTMGSYGTGAAGGIFAPLLVIGAQTGLLFGLLVQRALPGAVAHAPSFAVVGMAALFAAIVRAPLTGIVLIVEMTESYALMLPLLLACFVAYLFADLLGDQPIYEALLERDLLRSREQPELEEALLLDLVARDAAPFLGRPIVELGLPPGCLIVSLQRGLRTEVPSRDTTLRAGDRVTVALAPAAAGFLPALRAGIEGDHS
jgi:CIC family chloride channel protein